MISWDKRNLGMPAIKPLSLFYKSYYNWQHHSNFDCVLKQFTGEYDHYNQSNLVQRPRELGVTRFSLQFSSIKTPSIFIFWASCVLGFRRSRWGCGNWVHSTALIGSNYTRYTTLFHIRPHQATWALVTSQDILVGIRHVTNVITWPGIYESRSRDRISGHVIGPTVTWPQLSLIWHK